MEAKSNLNLLYLYIKYCTEIDSGQEVKVSRTQAQAKTLLYLKINMECE